MKIFKDKNKLIRKIYKSNKLSFVPTMGGLHMGHEYLIKKAKKTKCKVIVSIFVNPKQFNSRKDFYTYPRNLKKDLQTLKKLNVDYVYTPKNNDIFSFKTKNKIYEDKFSKKLCGKFRKNHFKGVLIVVNRLLEIINPKYMILGKKDYQQLYLINKHIKKRKIKTTVLSSKIIREKNGLPYSSRNFNLNFKERRISSSIYKILFNFKKKIKSEKKLNLKTNIIVKKLKNLGIKKNKLFYFFKFKNVKSSKNK